MVKALAGSQDIANFISCLYIMRLKILKSSRKSVNFDENVMLSSEWPLYEILSQIQVIQLKNVKTFFFE